MARVAKGLERGEPAAPSCCGGLASRKRALESKSARSVKGFGEQASSRQLTLAKPQVTAL